MLRLLRLVWLDKAVIFGKKNPVFGYKYVRVREDTLRNLNFGGLKMIIKKADIRGFNDEYDRLFCTCCFSENDFEHVGHIVTVDDMDDELIYCCDECGEVINKASK